MSDDLVKTITRPGVIRGSIEGATRIPAFTPSLRQVWRQHARKEIVAVEDWQLDPSILITLEAASGVDLAVGIRKHDTGTLPTYPFEVGVSPSNPALARRLRQALNRRHALRDLVQVLVLGDETASCDLAIAESQDEAMALAEAVDVRSSLLVVMARSSKGLADQLTDVHAIAGGLDAAGTAVVSTNGAPQVTVVGDFLEHTIAGKSFAASLGAATRSSRSSAVAEMAPSLLRAAAGKPAPRRRSSPQRDTPPDYGLDLGPAPPSIDSDEVPAVGRGGGRPSPPAEPPPPLGGDSPRVRRTAPHRATANRTKSEARFLQAQVYVRDARNRRQRTTAFVKGKRQDLWLRIGPGGLDWQSVPSAFPAAKALRDSQAVDLDVDVTVFADEPVVTTTTITLPEAGPSKVAKVPFEVPASNGTLEIAVLVRQNSRILQCAVLRGAIAPRRRTTSHEGEIAFDLRAVAADGWLDRQPKAQRRRHREIGLFFTDDHALVVDGFTTIAVTSTNLQQLESLGAQLGAELTGQAESVRMASKSSESRREQAYVECLRVLAANGRSFSFQLEATGVDMSRVRMADGIRVLSGSEAVVLPVELAYSNDVDERANPCAMDIASCTCTGPPDPMTICLRQFWGLGKVVERHAPLKRSVDERPSRAAVPVRRKPLRPLDNALLGSSDELSSKQKRELAQSLGPVMGKVALVSGWTEWEQEVDPERGLAIAIVHHEESGLRSRLEMGGELRRLDEIPKMLGPAERRTGRPIVLLVGCDTAAGQGLPASFVSTLRAAGAPIVLATMSEIAPDAAPALVLSLAEAIADGVRDDKGIRFGEALTRARGDLLAKGSAYGLSLMAFGDAQWILRR